MAKAPDQTKQRTEAKERARLAKRGAQPLADLTGPILSPAAKKRGFASVDLFSYWPDIVGPAYAEFTQPERLSWPRRLEDGGESGFEPALLIVRCEGPRAILLQHEEPAIVERINAIFGYRAVAKIRIVQKPVERLARPAIRAIAPLPAEEEARLAEEVAGIADDGLKAALLRLGRAVRAKKLTKPRGNTRM
ncbi:MAG: DciA family protein [Ancalomicrobiaceae bacterium]|nr:DciA family protein [Ancalomicrobiaceae bacterium]